MTANGKDDSHPSRPVVSQRPTARDVPIAKYKEPSSAPRGLRGQSLLPGQGAPERIVPEDIELAVLREADTLDGPHVARAAARQLPDLNNSPPPTPVSVEVPRVRSVPPSIESYGTTPTTPSARSVQSGTLMSIGSVDPRAPTELSLPSPRTLSQSERAAYLGPEAVVDRTPVSAMPSVPRDLVDLARNVEFAAIPERRGLRSDAPQSSPRSVPAGSGASASNARRSHGADSSAPHGRHFGHAPQSYSPVSQSLEPHSMTEPPSVEEGPPQFAIHSQLDAVPHEYVEDNFDLRSVSTQREPLASRKPMDSSDWSTVHEPASARRASSVPSERAPSRNPSSSSAITILVDPERQSLAPMRDSVPSLLPVAPARASVPLSWVLGAAAFALLLALAVAWVMRVPTPHEAARPAEDPRPDARSQALGTALPSLQSALPSPQVAGQSAGEHGAASVTPGSSATPNTAPKPLPAGSAPRAETPGNALASARPALAPSAHTVDLHAPAASSGEVGAKARQSIY